MKIIKVIFYCLVLISFCFSKEFEEQPELTLYSDNDPDMPTGVILIDKPDKTFIAMCCGGQSSQSATCVIKSEGKIIGTILKGSLVDVNTDIDSHQFEDNEKHPFVGKITDSSLIITDVNVSDLCGLNSVFVWEYFRLTSEMDVEGWKKTFIDLMEGYDGNGDLLPLLKTGLEQYTADNSRTKALNDLHEKTFKLYKDGDKADAAEQVRQFFSKNNSVSVKGLIYKNNIDQYNDLGFFLEQGEKYAEAVNVLEEVVKVAPERTVAYINLGDAYWGLKNKENATGSYREYIKFMKKNGKENKIPKRVLERVDE